MLRPWVWWFLAVRAEGGVGTGTVKTVSISKGAERSFAAHLLKSLQQVSASI